MTISEHLQQDAHPGQALAPERRQRENEGDLDLSVYLGELQRSPLLTAEQEVALAQQVETGIAARATFPHPEDADSGVEREAVIRAGDAAYRTLVESNLRLVISVARHYNGRGVDLADLIQEGNLGLCRAVPKYDWRHGTRFSTYATWWIRQAVHRCVVNQGRFVRLPAHIDGQVSHAQYALRQLEQELGRAPSSAECRDRLGAAAEKLVAPGGVIERPISLEASVADDVTVADLVPDPLADDPSEIVTGRLMACCLDDAIGRTLDAREAHVLRLRYGLGGQEERTLVEIGAELGMSRERARQIEVVALRKLRCSVAVQQQFGTEAS